MIVAALFLIALPLSAVANPNAGLSSRCCDSDTSLQNLISARSSSASNISAVSADADGARLLVWDVKISEVVEFPLPEGVSDFSGVFVEDSHVLILSSDGRLFAVGSNWTGQLGLGDYEDRFAFTEVPLPAGVSGWSRIETGYGYTLAFTTDARLFAWGRNDNGQLGLGDTVDRNTPTEVPLPAGVSGWTDVSSGYDHSLAFTTDARLFAWGRNDNGQLGLGDAVDRNTPTEVPLPAGVSGWSRIETGRGFTLALTTDGRLFTWGANYMGQLGLGDYADRDTPTEISFPAGVAGWTDIFVGSTDHSLALTTDGRLFSWGRNQSGQLGLGDNVDRSIPTEVPKPAGVDGWTNFYPGAHNTLAFTTDGRFFAWGHAGEIELYHINSSIPIEFPLPEGFIAWGLIANRCCFFAALAIPTPTSTLPMADTLTKTLRLPAGTAIPTLEFSFTFTPTQVVLITDPPAVSSVPVASVPTIATQSLSFSSATPYAEDGGIRVATRDLELDTLINNLTFPHAGTFVWNIEEVQSTTPAVTAPSNISFSQARYEMRVVVDRDLEVVSIALYIRTLDIQDQEIDSKVDVANFTNTYSTATSLYVRKTTEGRLANPDLDFDFTLTLTNPTLGGTIGTITAHVVAVGDTTNTPIRTVSITAGANTFSLSHNERLVIPTLPIGTTFIVSEAASPEYSAGAVITIGGTPQTPAYQNTNRGTALTTGSYTLVSGTNSAHFTNVHYHVPDTGLFLNNLTLLPAVLGLLALAMLTANRKRKRIEEIPVV